MKKKKQIMKIKKGWDLFSGEVTMLPLDVLEDFPENPFPQEGAERLERLHQDVKENGILAPLLVRPLENGRYQILDGYARKRAAQMAGVGEVPCILFELDDKETVEYFVEKTKLDFWKE